MNNNMLSVFQPDETKTEFLDLCFILLNEYSYQTM